MFIYTHIYVHFICIHLLQPYTHQWTLSLLPYLGTGCLCCAQLLSHVRLCNPMECSPPGSSVHADSPGMQWSAMPSSRRSSQPRNQTQVSHFAGRFFTDGATRKAQEYWSRLSLLQGIFLTQEVNWGLLHCRQILYQLSYQGSPIGCIYLFKLVFHFHWINTQSRITGLQQKQQFYRFFNFLRNFHIVFP